MAEWVQDGKSLGRESALQGSAWSGFLGAGARLSGLARQLMITASFGLAAPVDAFVASLTVSVLLTGLAIEVLDGAAVPALVRRRIDSVEEFRSHASRLIRTAIASSTVGALVLVAAAPTAVHLVPGFDQETRALTVANVRLMAPYVLAFGPFYCIGGVLRAARLFRAYAVAEVGVSIASLALLVPIRAHWWAMAATLSLAYVLGLVGLMIYGWLRLGISPWTGAVSENGSSQRLALGAVLPFFFVSQLYPLTDRAVASLLGSGAISALWYATLIASLPTALLSVKALAVTPLTEARDRRDMVGTMVSLAVIVGIPLGGFVLLRAGPLVSWLFERRAFDSDDVRATASALRWFGLAMPLLFLWPICLRLLQILGRHRFLFVLSASCVAINVALDLVFAVGFGWGLSGIAVATVLGYAFLLVFSLLEAARHEVVLDARRLRGSLGPSLLATAGGVVATLCLETVGIGLPWTGGAYVVACAVVLLLCSTDETRRLRRTVALSFPRLAPDRWVRGPG